MTRAVCRAEREWLGGVWKKVSRCARFTCALRWLPVQASCRLAGLSKKTLGIRRAEGQFVHWDHLKLTGSTHGRRWTGLVVALTVTFTVCDAQQIVLSASRAMPSLDGLSFFQTKLPEQKAPQALGPIPIFNETMAIRGTSGSSRHLRNPRDFQYAFAPLALRSASFCLRLNSFESPRAPPFMDPPISC